MLLLLSKMKLLILIIVFIQKEPQKEFGAYVILFIWKVNCNQKTKDGRKVLRELMRVLVKMVKEF